MNVTTRNTCTCIFYLLLLFIIIIIIIITIEFISDGVMAEDRVVSDESGVVPDEAFA